MERKSKQNEYKLQWNSDRVRQVKELALLGATDKQMAGVMGINVQTLDYWKRTKPIFAESLREGKMEADAKVAAALYKRATGYKTIDYHFSSFKGDVTKTKYVKEIPADVIAAKTWLTIRQRELWADIMRTESKNTQINITKLDLSGLSTAELLLAKKLGLTQLQSTNNFGGVEQN